MKQTVAFFLILISFFSFGQEQEVDSLIRYAETESSFEVKKQAYQKVIQIYQEKKLGDDTLMVFSLQQLAFLYWRESPDRLDSLAGVASDIARKIDYPYGVTESKFLHGFAEDLRGNFDSALALYFQALEEMRALDRLYKLPTVLEYIGIVYSLQGRFEESFSYYSDALKMYEARSDTQRIGNVYNSIGNLFNKKSDYDLLDTIIEEKRTFELPTDFHLINPFLNELLDMMKRFVPLEKKTMLSIRLSIYEMLVNAMEHGNLEINYEDKKLLLEKIPDYQRYLQERAQAEPYSGRKVWLTYLMQNKSLLITIEDEGKGFDTSSLPSPVADNSLSDLNGRGIFITKVNMDEVNYNEKGNKVTLVKQLDQ